MPTFFQDFARAVIPLSTAGRRIGALQFSFSTPRKLDPDEQQLVVALANQCAQALERAQLYEREHYIAKTLQQAFLPAALPEVPGVKIDAVYVPAASDSALGGDWYDVMRSLNAGRHYNRTETRRSHPIAAISGMVPRVHACPDLSMSAPMRCRERRMPLHPDRKATA